MGFHLYVPILSFGLLLKATNNRRLLKLCPIINKRVIRALLKSISSTTKFISQALGYTFHGLGCTFQGLGCMLQSLQHKLYKGEKTFSVGCGNNFS